VPGFKLKNSLSSKYEPFGYAIVGALLTVKEILHQDKLWGEPVDGSMLFETDKEEEEHEVANVDHDEIEFFSFLH
jgi:hypothetical protein